jgi:hypothetical protein
MENNFDELHRLGQQFTQTLEGLEAQILDIKKSLKPDEIEQLEKELKKANFGQYKAELNSLQNTLKESLGKI